MAKLLLLRAQIAVIIGLLALSAATARPCRTFIISSYTFSFPSDNNNNDDLSLPNTATLTTFTEIHSFIPLHIKPPSLPAEIFLDRHLDAAVTDDADSRRPQIRSSSASVPFGFSADDFSSLRDRTKDILSVVVALLFGVGCGALTAATMYLVWSMFSSSRYEYHSNYDAFLDDHDDDEEEKIESPKKSGYVKIPAKEAAPAKEAV